ncbi:MAG TPA: tetratricopeptide repeat protein [Rhodothermales bacterium]|nr:tetratricopeptide repeat protein [Rhodothermales bacterium]
MDVPAKKYRTNTRTRRASVTRLAGLVFLGVFLSACSGNSFVARKFDDFTAHYNKFYNANRTFQQQERNLEQGDEKIDTDRYLTTFELPRQRGRSAEFEKVITKSADLLRNHPRSKWVDDALMLIGKSYFYQSNFVGAEQKFNEIINLEGELKDEAEFWLARTLVAGQSTTAAEEIIAAALADEDLDKKWRARFLLLRGDLRTDVGRRELAIADIEEGLEHVDDGDTSARAYFLLGQLYEQEGRFEDAVEAYRRAQGKKPLYELAYAALVGEIRALGLHADPEAALDKLQRAMRENKHFQNRYHLQYMQARVLASAGDPIAAQEGFFEQLYPSDPTRRTNLRGEVHYRLGELYRDYLGDFYAAGVHFDTASTALPGAPAQNEQWAPDAIIDAKEAAATFRDYRETLDQVTRMDSLLYLGSLDAAAFDSAVAAVRVQLAEEAARIQAELERIRTESRFRQAVSDTDSRAAAQPRQTTDGSALEAFGFLNHKNLQRVQEAFQNFKDVWGDRPLVPGWRREEAVALAQRQASTANGAPGETNENGGSGQQVRFLPPVDVSEVPRDSASQAEMRAERAEARYRLANVLFLSIGLPDSAAKWYRRVIDEDTDQAVAHRALYAMAEVHEALGDAEQSRRTLERVIDRYPDSEFAGKARARLGIEVETEFVSTDTLEIATGRYEDAYRFWEARDYRSAIDSMVRVAADFPETEIAAKSLLAAARIFLEKAHRDGDDYYGVIQLSDSLFTDDEVVDAIAAAAPPPTQKAPSDSSETSLPDSASVDSSAAPGLDTVLVDTEEPPTADADLTASPEEITAEETVAEAPDTVSTRGVADRVAERALRRRGDEKLVVTEELKGPRSDELAVRPDADRNTPVVADDADELPPERRTQRLDLEKEASDSIAIASEEQAPPAVDTPQFVGARAEIVDPAADSSAIAASPDAIAIVSPQTSPPQAADTTASPDIHPQAVLAPDDTISVAAAPDTMASLTPEDIASAVDSTLSEGIRPAVAEAVDDSAASTPPAPRTPSTTPPAPKVPEIEWTKPDYFVHGIIPIPMTLHALYGSVATHFSQTPYGERAVELRQGLEAARTALAVAELASERAAVDTPGGAPDVDEPERESESSSAADTPAPAPGSILTAPDSTLARPSEATPDPVLKSER